MRTLLLTSLAGLVLAAAARAETYAITDAVVHTVSPKGTLERATVVIEDGRIAAVGADVTVPADAEVFDGQGKVVTPGFFDPSSYLGLVEVRAEMTTVDVATQNPRFTAAHAVADAINPRSVLIPVNRIEGITRAIARPSAGVSIFGGRSALISLGSVDDFLLREHAAMHVTLGEQGAMLAGGSRGSALLALRETLEDARDFASHREAFADRRRYEYARSRHDLAALEPVLDGELPLVVDVHRASDIAAVLRVADEFDVRVVISGGAEAHLVADALAAAEVPVILNPLANLPASFERLGSTLENAAILHAAGVTVAFTEGDSHNARNLKQGAGNAVAHGLPWRAALEALTINPAMIFGVENYGRIAPGFDADVVIWDGDPLEGTTFAEQVFIRGRKIPMESRQTLLRDRYLAEEERPQAYAR